MIEEEEKIYKFKINHFKSIIFSITQFSFIRSNRSIPANTSTSSISDMANIADIKMIIQNAINPLIDEIRGLKKEIQQLKTEKANIIEIIIKESKVIQNLTLK